MTLTNKDIFLLLHVWFQDSPLENPLSGLGNASKKKASIAPQTISTVTSKAPTSLKKKPDDNVSKVQCNLSCEKENENSRKRKRLSWNKSDDALLKKVFRHSIDLKRMPNNSMITHLKKKNHGLKDRHTNVIRIHLKALVFKK